MIALPQAALPLLRSVAGACVLPTAKRLLTLMLGAILTTGRRTISNLLRAVRGLAPGHPSSYHRVFSRRRWSLWPLARGLADLILRHWAPEGTVTLAGDDTVDEHRGAQVYGKGRHRDPVRSTRSYTAYRWGHKWVVLAILVRFPFARRPWALPVLVALYRSPDWDRQHGRRHKTPARLLRQLVALLLHWFPHRRFTLTADGNYGSHEMARFAHRHRRRLTLVSRFVPKAQLYTPPPVITGKRPAHRPRKKGEKLPTPEATVAAAAPADRTACNVSWYGGGRRDIEVVTGTGNWHRNGEGLVPLRWVHVRDRTGTHREDYLFSTDPEMAATGVVETYTGRWNDRDHPARDACVLGIGDDARMEGGDGVAAGAVPVRAVLGGRGGVRPVAGADEGRGPGGMAGQGRDDLLRRHHGGKALAVGGLGFRKPWVRRGLLKTLTPVPGGLAFSLGTACLTVEEGTKTS